LQIIIDFYFCLAAQLYIAFNIYARLPSERHEALKNKVVIDIRWLRRLMSVKAAFICVILNLAGVISFQSVVLWNDLDAFAIPENTTIQFKEQPASLRALANFALPMTCAYVILFIAFSWRLRIVSRVLFLLGPCIVLNNISLFQVKDSLGIKALLKRTGLSMLGVQAVLLFVIIWISYFNIANMHNLPRVSLTIGWMVSFYQ
jgi:hypothetical protein